MTAVGGGMPLDYNSLLLAIGISGACLAVTMFGSWLSAPKERFLLTWSVGVLLIVINVVAYDFYVEQPGSLIGMVTFASLIVGLATLLGAAYQFRTRGAPWLMIAGASGLACAIALPPMVLGHLEWAFFLYNAVCAVIVLATAADYWRCRREAPLPISALVGLYGAIGLSFVACAAMIAFGPGLQNGVPVNWAEDVNIIVSIIGMSGIGALSLALNQWRVARGHREASVTDQLTGLMNRRALFERHGSQPIAATTAVILFDLDHFKALNDEHGHAVGDDAIRLFSLIMKTNVEPGETAARLGGEEFVVVLPSATAERAEKTAQSIRAALSDMPIRTATGTVRCTVSAGIAFGTVEGAAFDRVLGEADQALYESKRGGRDRVSRRTLRLVS